MVIELIVAQPFENLKSIECPQRGGINFPCAICQECDIGEMTLTSGNGYVVENTVNSVLIHVELNIQKDDPLEQAALKALKNSLSEKVSFIQKGDWELGEFQILLSNDMIKNMEVIGQVESFIEDFPKQFRKLMIDAKRALTTWSEKEATAFAHKHFRNL